MVLLIPEGVVFLLCGLLQHLRECLFNKRHGLLKALLAVANLCLLYYTNAPISEDLMLLKSTIYAFFFVSACVKLSVCVNSYLCGLPLVPPLFCWAFEEPLL